MLGTITTSSLLFKLISGKGIIGNSEVFSYRLWTRNHLSISPYTFPFASSFYGSKIEGVVA